MADMVFGLLVAVPALILIAMVVIERSQRLGPGKDARRAGKD